jgi:hypothetical protein
MMERDEYIHIPPKRRGLPWRYTEQPQLTRKQLLRLTSIALTLCAGMAWLFWQVLKVRN